MSQETSPQPYQPIEDIHQAWAAAEAEGRMYGFAATHELLAVNPVEGALTSPDQHLEQAAKLRADAPHAGEIAAEKYANQQRQAETSALVDSTTPDIEQSLHGETVGKKISTIRQSLLDIEERRNKNAPDQVSEVSEEDLSRMDATERSLQNSFYNLARANPQLIPGLYLDSITNYVGRKVTEGQSLEDIMKNRRTNVEAHDVVGQELASLELLFRDLDTTGPETEDRAWEAVIRSYDPEGRHFSPAQAVSKHGGYVDLREARHHFESMLDQPDERDKQK